MACSLTLASAKKIDDQLSLMPVLTMSPKIYINGKLYEKHEAKISVYDHGLLYGDGVFEGIRSYGGKVFRLREHLDRLWYSAKAIRLEIPMTKDALAKAVEDTLAVNGIDDGYVRLVKLVFVFCASADAARSGRSRVHVWRDEFKDLVKA